jgi:uncharacterized membrane protein (Fun14 family)
MQQELVTPLTSFAGSAAAGFFIGWTLRKILKIVLLVVGLGLGVFFLNHEGNPRRLKSFFDFIELSGALQEQAIEFLRISKVDINTVQGNLIFSHHLCQRCPTIIIQLGQ